MKKALLLIALCAGLASCNDAEKYTLNCESNNLAWGTVEGAGYYPAGTVVEIKAIPNENCTFERWLDGNKSNPRTVTVEHSITYTAIFSKN
ncbi:MAG: hypothetical protein J6X62_04380 [Bacteroidales bacterium]|nr:hypothetical protein [Bacteroidales bacterium]